MVEGYEFATQTRKGIEDEVAKRGWDILNVNNNFDANTALTNADAMVLKIDVGETGVRTFLARVLELEERPQVLGGTTDDPQQLLLFRNQRRRGERLGHVLDGGRLQLHLASRGGVPRGA